MAKEISEEDKTDILESLAVIAEERLATIHDTKEERERLEAAIAQLKQDIWERHYKANRVLIQAIDAAAKEGIPKAEIYDRIGINRQYLYGLRRSLKAWEDGNRYSLTREEYENRQKRRKKK